VGRIVAVGVLWSFLRDGEAILWPLVGLVVFAAGLSVMSTPTS
jgi:hypothetical protein